MKRLLVVALATLIAIGFAPSACAQRSAARGGFSGHAAPAVRGGFTTSAPHSFTGAPRYTGSAPRNFVSRPINYNLARYRRPYPSRYGYGVPYIGVGWIGPGYLDSGYLEYPDATAYDDSQAPPNYAAGYDTMPPDQAQPAPAPPYRSYGQLPQAPSAPLADEDPVTLIFKDGRPPEQIRNYAMTRSTIYVRDQHHRDIPLDQLDLAATQKVNHDAGMDFQLPQISQ
jgi:hypothetical protein